MNFELWWNMFLMILQTEFELSIASHIATTEIVKFLIMMQLYDLGSYTQWGKREIL